MALTKKQKQVYDFIYYYIQENSYAPTQQEIKRHFGFRSLGSVQDYIRYLSQAEYIRNDSNATRGLEALVPLEKRESLANENALISLPLLGSVAAGLPMEKYKYDETVDIPSYLVGKGNHYAVEIEGYSMVDEGILPGDIAIIKEQSQAENGQTAIVLTQDQGANIKKFYAYKDRVELHSANKDFPPIIIKHSHWKILGVLKGLYRQYL